ncbi:MAG: YccF domain-containing protein [Actinomycetota bacterium]
MKAIGNILWFVLAGIWLAIGYTIAGLLMCITIIGIPFGIQAFKLAGFVLWPFGRTVVAKSEALSVLDITFNVLWLFLVGWELFLLSIAAGLLLCITIIGIPFGIQAFKLSVLALWPFGQTVVSEEQLAVAG